MTIAFEAETLIALTFLTLFIFFSYTVHKQYMIGHDTWLFKHSTPLELKIQEHKLSMMSGQ